MFTKIFEGFNKILGNITAVFLLLMMFNVLLDVILRYFFSYGSIALQELEWHFFAVMFLLGISYALQEEAHVRVDFIYEKFSERKKVIINIVGTFIFLIPFVLYIIYGSYEFVFDAYNFNEISENPGGLTHRWIIKAMIPLSFFILFLSSLGYIHKNILIIRGIK